MTTSYGCSRMTVNKALSDLVRRGLIERRRKAGSYVSHPHVQSAVLEIHDLRREVQALGLPYAYSVDIRRKRRTKSADRTRLDLPSSATVLDVMCRHFADGHPFCVEDRLINLDAVPEAAGEDFASLPPGSWLLGKVPWSAAEHRIRAVAADSAIAAALAIPAGTACLVVERRTWSGDTHITHVRLTYPGDRHELVAQFAPA
ncbi:MAG: UTRA domain-containing protein [Rhizobiaceae bacterium]|nr:UTRA domain-containing protein [Rhizobiaceae bacterium]